MSDFEYRLLDPSYAAAVCDVHRAAFTPEQLIRTIYCSPRVQRYIADIMPNLAVSHTSPHEFVGAIHRGELVAYAHFRGLPASWHLNQLAVRPEYQGCGIGRRLVQIWRDRAALRGFDYLSLDVDASNTGALQWYRRLGFHDVEASHWYESLIVRSVETVSKPPRGKPVDWDETQESIRRYGFGIIRLEYGDRRFEVGWLWQSLRILASFPGVVLEDAIRLASGTERLFLICSWELPKVSSKGRTWRYAGTTIRMGARASDLLKGEVCDR